MKNCRHLVTFSSPKLLNVNTILLFLEPKLKLIKHKCHISSPIYAINKWHEYKILSGCSFFSLLILNFKNIFLVQLARFNKFWKCVCGSVCVCECVLANVAKFYALSEMNIIYIINYYYGMSIIELALKCTRKTSIISFYLILHALAYHIGSNSFGKSP